MRSAIGPVPEIDTNIASQTSYTKVFASGGSFLDVCGELIGVDQSPPFISNANLLWKAFRYPTDIDFLSNHVPYFTFQAFVIA